MTSERNIRNEVLRLAHEQVELSGRLVQPGEQVVVTIRLLSASGEEVARHKYVGSAGEMTVPAEILAPLSGREQRVLRACAGTSEAHPRTLRVIGRDSRVDFGNHLYEVMKSLRERKLLIRIESGDHRGSYYLAPAGHTHLAERDTGATGDAPGGVPPGHSYAHVRAARGGLSGLLL